MKMRKGYEEIAPAHKEKGLPITRSSRHVYPEASAISRRDGLLEHALIVAKLGLLKIARKKLFCLSMSNLFNIVEWFRHVFNRITCWAPVSEMRLHLKMLK